MIGFLNNSSGTVHVTYTLDKSVLQEPPFTSCEPVMSEYAGFKKSHGSSLRPVQPTTVEESNSQVTYDVVVPAGAVLVVCDGYNRGFDDLVAPVLSFSIAAPGGTLAYEGAAVPPAFTEDSGFVWLSVFEG